MFSTRGNSDSPGNSATEGEIFSRRLANKHYENFSIAAIFLPRRLKQDLFNVYAFCRLADNIADEPVEGVNAFDAIDIWENQLEKSVEGHAETALFSALGGTISRHGLSLEPFKMLLDAFRWDLKKKRWKSWKELREYTRFSADPVGRIVLQMCGYQNEDYFAQSDNICTALQLANHWQDVAEDWKRERLYIPQDDLQSFNVSEDDIACGHATPEFRKLMTFEVERARNLFQEGRSLISMVGKPLKYQLMLYWQGGVSALEAIEKIDYDVLSHSARTGKFLKLKIFSAVLQEMILPRKNAWN